MDFFHSEPIQIRFNDVDPLGHVNNAVFFSYFDIGRFNYFHEVLGLYNKENTEGVIIASTKADFRKELGLFNNVEVVTRTTRIGNKSFDILQQIRDITTKDIFCESKTVMVGFDFKNRQTIPILESWKKAIIEHDGEVEIRSIM